MRWLGKKTWLVVLVLGSLAGMGWWQRTPLWSWYTVRQLVAAEEATRATWVERVVALDEAALPRLLEQLHNPETKVCANVEAALVALVQRWGGDDPRSLHLIQQLKKHFGQWSKPGQQAALQVTVAQVLQVTSPVPAALAQAAGELLTRAVEGDAPRTGALRLAGVLLDRATPGQWLPLGRTLAEQALTDSESTNRVLAVHLCLQVAKHAGTDLLAKVPPLLRDPQPEVRRAALIALAGCRDVLMDDDLLPLLHDADAEVRVLCETALRSRGLAEHHLLLARLISDQRPTARLQVLHQLQGAADLEPGIWLRRLSQDPAPAVRAAAVRAAATHSQVDLRDRLKQMAQDDPSPTVRQLAEHYLRRRTVRGVED